MATALAVTLLTSAWAWLWTMTAAADRLGGAGETQSSVAFAVRVITREVGRAQACTDAGAMGCTRHSLCVTVVHPSPGSAEIVTYAWEPVRGVLWRKTPSDYLCERVSRFDVEYRDRSGLAIVPADGDRLDPDQLATVAAIRISLAAGDHADRTSREWTVLPGDGP
jgi:hypothetical protein